MATEDLQILETERAVVGALIIEPNSIRVIEGILTEDSFSDHRHKEIFSAVQRLDRADKPIDIVTVIQELTRAGKIQMAGGIAYVSELATLVNSTSHLPFHARLLYDSQLKRKAGELGKKLIEDSTDPTAEITDTLSALEDELIKLSMGGNMAGKHISKILPSVLNDIADARENERGITGISSGFNEIDQLTNGFNPTDLIILAARPGMGKTAQLLCFFRSISVDYQLPSLIFSYEMSEKQLVNRLLVLQSQVPNDAIKHGRLSDSEASRVEIATGALEQAPIYVIDDSSLTIYGLRAKARKYVKEKGVKIIGIDYLQLMNSDTKSRGSREQDVAAISRGLKQLAKELNVPIIALSQLNRGVEERPDKRPRLSDLRESGSIEQDADQVCFVHRPEYYGILEDKSNGDLRGKAEYIIAKQRNGRTGSIWVRFDGNTMRFYPEDGGFLQSTVGNSDLPF